MRFASTNTVIGAGVAALLILCPAIASAAVGLSIQPVKVSETMQPGQTVTGEILLKNVSDVAVVVDVSKQDFLPVAGADSIQFVQGAPGVTTVKDWITIDSVSSFSFAVGESKAISYSITAPLDAEPGGHFGVMLFKATDAEQEGTLKVGTQVGMLVLVAIPGNRLEQGNVQEFTTKRFIQHGPVSFQMKFENTGTVHFEPRGTIAIYNMFGSHVADVPIEGQVVLPRGIKTLTEEWQVSRLLVGRYTAVASIVAGGEEIGTQTIEFYAFPLWYTLGFLGCLIVVFFVIRFIKRRVKISIVSQ